MGFYGITGLILIALGVLMLMSGRYINSSRNRISTLKADTDGNPDTPDGVCCGKHLVCEKKKIAEKILSESQYFEDEDLDRFAGKSSGEYTDTDIEEFRYVLYTLRQEEVQEWLECLSVRGIEFPDQLKDEAYTMVNETI